MDDTDLNLRKATFDTLDFLASTESQQQFAAKVYYANYAAEFACWWFDSFDLGSPFTAARYTNTELVALRAFSTRFDELLKQIIGAPCTIETLLASPQWIEITHLARVTRHAIVSNAQ